MMFPAMMIVSGASVFLSGVNVPAPDPSGGNLCDSALLTIKHDLFKGREVIISTVFSTDRRHNLEKCCNIVDNMVTHPDILFPAVQEIDNPAASPYPS